MKDILNWRTIPILLVPSLSVVLVFQEDASGEDYSNQNWANQRDPVHYQPPLRDPQDNYPPRSPRGAGTQDPRRPQVVTIPHLQLNRGVPWGRTSLPHQTQVPEHHRDTKRWTRGTIGRPVLITTAHTEMNNTKIPGRKSQWSEPSRRGGSRLVLKKLCGYIIVSIYKSNLISFPRLMRRTSKQNCFDTAIDYSKLN